MGRKLRLHRRAKTGRHSKKTSEAKDNPINLPDPSETKPTEKTEKFTKENAPQSKDNLSDPPTSPEKTLTEDNPKDPPHPTKEPNPLINLDFGAKFGLDVSASSVDDCCNTTNNRMKTSIRNLPTCTQLSTTVATPKKTAEETNMSQLPSSTC